MKVLLALVFSFISTIVYAARPMITDDARVLDEGTCHIESWAKFNKITDEYWALPSCNPAGNFEVTIGGLKNSGSNQISWGSQLVQAKTLFKKPATNDWSLGLGIGQFSTNQNHDLVKTIDNYFYVPITQSISNDDLFVHINLGLSQNLGSKRYSPTFGVGSEYLIQPNMFFILESFQDSSEKMSLQGGLRYWIMPNKFQVDITTGFKSNTRPDNRWLSIGIRLISPKWF